jgi:hypothetical protein
VEAWVTDSDRNHLSSTIPQMKVRLFGLLALLTTIGAALVEIGTLDLGHELTWFGSLTPVQSAWVRHFFTAAAISSIVVALLSRGRNTQP